MTAGVTAQPHCELADAAHALVAATLGAHLDDVAMNAWTATLLPHARRIGRNALRAANLVTDNSGQPMADAHGAPLGVLWTFTAPGRWLSAHASMHTDPALALREWAEWAHDGAPPYRLTLLDAQVPLLGRGVFGVAPAASRTAFADFASATRHAYVLAILQTCQLQGRDPIDFLARLLQPA